MKNFNQPNTTIKVTLTHSILSIRIPEVRLTETERIENIKVQLERRFGTSAANMTLVLKLPTEENLCIMNNDDSTLQFYGVMDDYIIHCVDDDPNSILKTFENFEAVQKYVMSDEDYDKLPGGFISECEEVQRESQITKP